jgi:hypothetical protein
VPFTLWRHGWSQKKTIFFVKMDILAGLSLKRWTFFWEPGLCYICSSIVCFRNAACSKECDFSIVFLLKPQKPKYLKSLLPGLH